MIFQNYLQALSPIQNTEKACNVESCPFVFISLSYTSIIFTALVTDI